MAHRPTPHSIAVAALIALHCQQDSPLYEEGGTEFTLVDSFLRDVLLQSTVHAGDDWASLHGRRVQSLLRQLDAVQETNLKEGSTQDRNEGGHMDTGGTTRGAKSSIARHFHAWLMVATSSIDALTDLMTTIQRAVSDGSVDATSAHGVFLRSCLLGYDELDFDAVIDLWKDFSNQVRDESYQQQWMMSSQQVENAILEQCWKTATLVAGEPLVDEMQNDLRRILQLNPQLASAHLLRFILCLKSGERVGAMDALHQYMDYALSAEQHGEDILQFAAIVLAVLHDQFGERQLVASATDEAVRVAQQSQDAGAVAFALGWLAVYSADSQSQSLRQSLMQRCVQRAAGNLRPLWAGGSLSLAALTHSWTPLVQAVTDPTAATSTATGSEGGAMGDRPTHASYLDERYTGTTAAMAAARQKLVAAGLYSHFGETTLSAQASMSALFCQKDMSSTDATVAVQNLCATSTSGSTSLTDWNAMLEQGSVKAATSSPGCIYGTVLRTFVHLRERYRLPVDGVFHLDVALVLHEWAVRRRDMEHAETLMMAMESHWHPSMDNSEEIKFDMEAQQALFLSRQGQWNEAKTFLINAIGKRKQAKQHNSTARLLLQLSMVHLESAPTQFMNALHPLLECLSLCKTHKMDGLADSALLILAQIHLRMGQCKRTVQILQVVMPRLLQNGHVWLQAEAYLTLAKCHMKKATEFVTRSPKQAKVLQTALQQLRQSVALFTQCQDCHRLQEVYYLTARIYNILPDTQSQRDEAAKAFVQASTRPTLPSTPDILAAMSSRDGILQLADRHLDSSSDLQ